MISKPDKNKTRQRRHARVRGKISGTSERPRLNVFRSNKNIYAQLIDDVAGVTLASASTLDKDIKDPENKTDAAAQVGALIAKRAVADGHKVVVFDRGGYLLKVVAVYGLQQLQSLAIRTVTSASQPAKPKKYLKQSVKLLTQLRRASLKCQLSAPRFLMK